MNKDDLVFFQEWFDNYTTPFRACPEELRVSIDMKITHTNSVLRIMSYLCKELGLNEEKTLIAETIALFHDVGRFEQLKKYGTFRDEKSENHALLSVKVIKKEEVLERLSDEERRRIFLAVSCHNTYSLPDMTEEDLFFANLIRDADKLDIFRHEVNYFEERKKKKNEILELGLSDSSDCSEEVLKSVMNRICVNYKLLKTYNDFKLQLLGWIFELNFTPSLKFVKENGYVGKILASLPDTAEIRKLGLFVEEYLEQRMDHPRGNKNDD